MDYETACEAEITRKQAQQEIKAHGLSFDDFVTDCGDKAYYSGQVILDWLGY